MNQSKLARWLKIIIIGAAVCTLIVYAFIIPSNGQDLVYGAPEFAGWYLPWLIFISITAIPVGIAFVLCWRIAGNIGRDRSFSAENAGYFKWISWLAALDTAYFFVGNLVMLLLNRSHPGVVLLSLLIVFAGIAVTIAAAVLSHMCARAADLQEQSDLTI